MISIFNPPPASNPFHSPKLQSLFDDAVKQAWLSIAASPEMSMCIAAGVETETEAKQAARAKLIRGAGADAGAASGAGSQS